MSIYVYFASGCVIIFLLGFASGYLYHRRKTLSNEQMVEAVLDEVYKRNSEIYQLQQEIIDATPKPINLDQLNDSLRASVTTDAVPPSAAPNR